MTTMIPERRPAWLKVAAPKGENYKQLKQLMRGQSLHTVCEEARCPNIAECWGHKTATFMILGRICTRSCRFCAVETGRPLGLDWEEPKRVAEAVQQMGLRHAVVTSVNRDELKDGGAAVFASTIRWIRRLNPDCKVEVLTPDFKGDQDALRVVIDAKPDVFNHNVETIPRLYKQVRPQAIYQRSLDVLKWAKEMNPAARTKSGFMLGLGETWDEVITVMQDMRAHDVDILTIGQYLRPSFQHLPIQRYVPLEEFAALKTEGKKMGFRHVESGPFVRSSYHAHEQADEAIKTQE
ncbi:lipoyl synthase [Ktedonosporobacter rubrisoli]|uniref:Lipoyl synthase n=1 Tax=Ktedonosporobacter rubrisoli TaxID=2509675 RepID=A0A4P6K149_KTERU|nr:lipoyl synthase [Ktedonosporobacter rubrisoli]